MAREVVKELNHQVELRKSTGEIVFVRFVLLKEIIQALVVSTFSISGTITNLEKTQERPPKLIEHMVDLGIQSIRLEKRSPSLENRVRNL